MDTRQRWQSPRACKVAALISVAGVIVVVALALEPAHGPTWAAERAGASAVSPVFSEEALFLDANRSAMTTMMSAMSIRPTGDVDRDFVHMMVPHHQGAIDMAMAVLRYGHDPVLRRLAQEIIVTQQEEIAVMRRAVGERLPPSVPAPTSPRRSDQSGRSP